MTSKIILSYGSISHQGSRPYQEDTCYWLETPINGCIGFVLADGMGGHVSGDLASQTLVNAFREEFSNPISMETIAKTLRASLDRGNQRIKDQIAANPEHDGMGSTYLAGFVCNRHLHWISVGDSPLYLYSSGNLKQVNQDHSMAPVLQQSVAKGEISQEQADTHPHKNSLLSAVMGDPIEMVDNPTESLPLHVEDVVIVASDGLQTLSDQEIKSIIVLWARQGWVDDLTEMLLAAVISKNNPYQDNTTIMVAAFIPSDQAESTLHVENENLSLNQVSWSELIREDTNADNVDILNSKKIFLVVIVLFFLGIAAGVGAYYFMSYFVKPHTHVGLFQGELTVMAKY